jgi:ABC-type antimicrobial peptide transport system permease subunit
MVLAQGASMALLGVAIGAPLAYAAARGLAGTLFGVGDVEPLIMIAAAAMLTALVLAGAAMPAWRAARIDPVVALRAE